MKKKKALKIVLICLGALLAVIIAIVGGFLIFASEIQTEKDGRQDDINPIKIEFPFARRLFGCFIVFHKIFR